VPPKTTLWNLDPHTAAKHRLLRRYMNAWLPIMGRSRHRTVLLVDGFAGPGRYAGGEPGSPLVILDAFLSHRDRPRWAATAFQFVFIEKEQDRYDHLRLELDRLTLPANAKVIPILGEFDGAMKQLLDGIPEGYALPPSFVFVDPFGWTGHGLQLSSRILGFRRCEVLVYVPLPWIARFVGDDKVSDSFDNLLGDDSWRRARDLDDGQARVALLHDLILDKVQSMGRYARSFEIEAGGRGWNGYHLFFGTQNETGLDKMKYAMWQVDPVAGARFADSTNAGQLTLFEERPDLKRLQEALAARFGTDPFAIEEATRFTLLETPYHPSIHLKRGALLPLELAGRLEGSNRQRVRTYPDGTILRLKW
jgi:three-Cys-motif partner protein